MNIQFYKINNVKKMLQIQQSVYQRDLDNNNVKIDRYTFNLFLIIYTIRMMIECNNNDIYLYKLYLIIFNEQAQLNRYRAIHYIKLKNIFSS